MRWRAITAAALLGATLGFSGQFVADTVHDRFEITSSGLHWRKYLVDWWIDENVPPQRFSRAFELRCQYWCFCWLEKRGDVAGRTASAVAFLSVSSILVADKLGDRRKARKATAERA